MAMIAAGKEGLGGAFPLQLCERGSGLTELRTGALHLSCAGATNKLR